jgi:ADP-heptose:LPS heptosyltransferase
MMKQTSIKPGSRRFIKLLDKIGGYLSRMRRKLNHAPRSPEKILLVSLEHLSKVIQTLPALQLLKKTYPDSTINYLCGGWARSILKAHRDIDDVLVFNAPWMFPTLRTSESPSELSIAAMGWEIRRRQYDTIMCFQPDGRLNLLLGITGASTRIGFAGRTGNFLLTHDQPFSREIPGCQRNLDLLTHLGIKPYYMPPQMFPLPGDLSSTHTILDGFPPGQPIAVMYPGGSKRVHRWPPDRYRAVMDKIIADGFQILLLGGPGETDYVNTVARDMTVEQIQIWNFPTAGEALALSKSIQFYIGVDSGITHIMTAQGVPSIILAGSRHQTSSWLGLNHTVLYAEEPCSACLQPSPINLRDCTCTEAITVSAVLKAYETLRERSDNTNTHESRDA